MSDSTLVIVFPGLATILEQKINASVIPLYLSKIIKKATFQSNMTGLTRLLVNHFSQKVITSSDLPIAVLNSHHKFVLKADPCYLHVDRDSLLLFSDNLQLTLEESEQLIAVIQPLLEEFGAELVCWQTEQWLVKLKSLPDVTFYALPDVSGRSVEPFLPTGEEQKDWVRLWNEIQMQLYDCSINQQRVRDGKLPINSIWFWGAGEFNSRNKPWASVQGDNALLNTLAQQSNSPIINTFDYSVTSVSPGNNLWLLKGLDTEVDWQQELQQLDEQVFKPLWQYCKTAKISKIQLQIPDHGQYQLAPVDCWKFW